MQARVWDAAVKGDASYFNRHLEVDIQILENRTYEGSSLLHIAATMGHEGLVETLLSKTVHRDLVLTNSSGDIPLHCAARVGHARIVRLLIVSMKKGLVNINNLGNSPLHEAVKRGHVSAVTELLMHAPHIADINNKAGISPLYLAAERSSVEIVKSLLNTQLASATGPNGQTALHAAVLRSSEITKLILETKPRLLQQGDGINNSTPLHYAVSGLSGIKIVRLLLQSRRSAAYLQDNDGFSAIHVAAGMGHVEAIKELLKECPDCMEMKDLAGRNFLHVAIERKKIEVVKYVLQSPVLAELANVPDNIGNTSLHFAVLSRNKDIIRLLSGDAAVFKSPMNNSGDTPMDLASLKNDYKIGYRMDKIREYLMSSGSRFHPQRLDLLLKAPQRNTGEEINRYRALVSSYTVVAVLIATVTFAAAFTLPGGYKNDDGTSIKTSDLAFKIFLISDTIAMVSSIVATFMLMNGGSLDHDIRLYSLTTAKRLIWFALFGMTMAFGTNVLVVVKCKWLAILVCLISSCVLLASHVATNWHSFLNIFKRVRIADGVPIDSKIIRDMRAEDNHTFRTPNASAFDA